jgi:energy-coupling factor transporter ATP-binding protein EcfA2
METKPEYLSLIEVNALLKEISNSRDHAIVVLFLTTGIFMGELIELKVEAINWEKKKIVISGSRARTLILNQQAFDALSQWSKDRPQTPCPNFFITSKGEVKKLSDRSINHLIRKYAVQAKIIGAKKSVNVHTLRNTFATNLMAQDVSIKKASEVLGISDPKAIKRYTKESISRATQSAKLNNENKVEEQKKVIGDPQIVVEKNISKPEAPQKDIPQKDMAAISKTLEALDSRSKLRKFISKVFPSKPADMKASTSNALMSIQDQSQTTSVIDPETIIFGRSSVIAEITQNLSKGQSTLLTGKLGLGKSHILKHISAKLTPNRIYFSTPIPTKVLLTQICDSLYADWKDKLGTRASNATLMQHIAENKVDQLPVLILDNLDKLKTSDSESILFLLEHFTVLGAVADLNPKLKPVWWKFMDVELKPLKLEDSKTLIKHLTTSLHISNYEMLETKLLSTANGFPLAIVEMIHQLSLNSRITAQTIREADHAAGQSYRDWTPMIAVMWGALTAFRFISLGTHSFEGYILAGFGISVFGVLKFFMVKLR